MPFGLEPFTFFLLSGATLIGLYTAWSIGANDVANSMSTAVGAKAITLRQAVLIAGILNFCGAVFVGSHVTETVRKGIVSPTAIGDPDTLILGFLAALLSAAIFVTLSTWKELPVSTTHSIIGALAGFGLVAGGITAISWKKLGEVAASWVISPIVGAIIAFLIFRLIVHLIFAKEDPVKAAGKFGPVLMGVTFFIIFLSLFTKTQLGIMVLGRPSLVKLMFASLTIAVIAGMITFISLRKFFYSRKKDDYTTVELMFRKMQILTSCYVAFAHGTNDVANAIGPLAGIFAVHSTGSVTAEVPFPIWLLALGGVGIAVGVSTWGYKVIRTVGYRITKLTNSRGFCIDFGAATTVLIASKLGLPISTSHTVVGAVIGVGLARGLDAVDFSVIKKIIYAWVITLPAAAIISILIYMGLNIIV